MKLNNDGTGPSSSSNGDSGSATRDDSSFDLPHQYLYNKRHYFSLVSTVFLVHGDSDESW